MVTIATRQNSILPFSLRRVSEVCAPHYNGAPRTNNDQFLHHVVPNSVPVFGIQKGYFLSNQYLSGFQVVLA